MKIQVDYIEAIKMVLSKPLFVCTMLAIACLFFVVTGLQFWISEYLIVTLVNDRGVVFAAFSIVSITAPTLGVMIGGHVSTSLGGYTGKHALQYCLVVAILGTVVAMPIPYFDSLWIIIPLLWLLFFFGGALLPTLTGVMISSIKLKARSIGSSIAQFMQNLLGYLPAPILYGLVVQESGGKSSRWGMVVLMSWSLLGVAFLSAAVGLQIRRRNRKIKTASGNQAEPLHNFERDDDDEDDGIKCDEDKELMLIISEDEELECKKGAEDEEKGDPLVKSSKFGKLNNMYGANIINR